MTCFTDDRWIASLEQSPSGRRTFHLSLSPEPSASDARPAAFTTHNEACCSIVVSGVFYGSDAGERTVSDAVRVFRAYARGGYQSLASLRGAFAGVVWDERREVLIAFRDPLGIHPLFVARDSAGCWLVAPAIAPLVVDRRVDTPVNRTVLAERLIDQWASRDETEYYRLTRVLPGHALTISRDSAVSVRYWSPPAADLAVRHRPGAVERFDAAFRAAVARAADLGPAGIFLSGGIDSISVAATAAQHARSSGRQPPVALSLLYNDPDFQEAEIQRAVADELELPSRRIALQDAIGEQSAIGSLIALNAQWPVPAMNIWTPAFLQLARAGRALGCDVILTGGGGDEWLGVTPYFAADLLASLRFVDWYRFCRNTVRSYDVGIRGALSTLGWTFGLKPVLARFRDRASMCAGENLAFRWWARKLPEWIAPKAELREAIEERGRSAARHDRFLRATSPTFYDFETRRSLDHPLVVGELETRFHFGQLAGVRMIEPYWDADLIDLLYAMPPDDLSLGGFSKGLVHGVVQSALPDLPLIRQRKIAVTMAYQQRVRREGQQAWAAMGGVTALADLGIVDARKLERKVAAILADGNGNGVWLLPYVLSVEAWARAHA